MIRFKSAAKTKLKMAKNLVEQLKYAACDESVTYCEALEIISRGKTHHVLHLYHGLPAVGLVRTEGHAAIFYKSKQKLIREFPYGPGGFFGDDTKRGWIETDEQCGFADVPAEEFTKARERGLTSRLGYSR